MGAVTTPDKVEVPVTDRLPAATAPETVNDVSVPTDVRLGCAAVDRVPLRLLPEMLPVTDRDDRTPKEVMLGWAAVAKVPVIAPDTANADSVPREVMLGCAGVATMPTRLAPGAPTVVAVTVPASKVLATVRLVKVPISVMLG